MPPKRWRRPAVTVSHVAQDKVKEYADQYGEDLTAYAKVIARRGRLTEVQIAHIDSAREALERGAHSKEAWREACKILGGTVLGIVGAGFFTELQDHSEHVNPGVLGVYFIVALLSVVVIGIGVLYPS